MQREKQSVTRYSTDVFCAASREHQRYVLGQKREPSSQTTRSSTDTRTGSWVHLKEKGILFISLSFLYRPSPRTLKPCETALATPMGPVASGDENGQATVCKGEE